jgi:hypothetical protein
MISQVTRPPEPPRCPDCGTDLVSEPGIPGPCRLPPATGWNPARSPAGRDRRSGESNSLAGHREDRSTRPRIEPEPQRFEAIDDWALSRLDALVPASGYMLIASFLR